MTVFVLLLLHLGVAALWLGAMVYSLFVVQPRLARVLSDPEDAYRELGAGQRWKVVGLIGLLAASGAGLILANPGRSGLWWAVIAAKAALLIAAAGAFWWVSWRGWPRRIFALPRELPGIQRRFRRVALGLTALVGAAFILGVLASRVA